MPSHAATAPDATFSHSPLNQSFMGVHFAMIHMTAAAIAAISSGIHAPVMIAIAPPMVSNATVIAVRFLLLKPFFVTSRIATPRRTSPATIAVIAPPSTPNASPSPVTAAAAPMMYPVRLSKFMPFLSISTTLMAIRTAPATASASCFAFDKFPRNFFPIFHAANPAATAATYGDSSRTTAAILPIFPASTCFDKSNFGAAPDDPPPPPELSLDSHRFISSKPESCFFVFSAASPAAAVADA